MLRPLAFASLVLGILLAGIAVESREQRIRVPEPQKQAVGLRIRDFGSPRVLDGIMAAGALHCRPDLKVFEGNLDEEPKGLLVYSLERPQRQTLPSTTFARNAKVLAPRLDVLSIAIDPADWSHPEMGIDTNPLQRGRDWERGACLSFFEGERLSVETQCGVRIHGDTSRLFPDKSLRVVLSPSYGSSQLDASGLMPEPSAKSFVIHNDERRFYFVNPMAYEIARWLGCDAPATRPVKLLINGRAKECVYFLTEWASLDYLEARHGHRDFLTMRAKGKRVGYTYGRACKQLLYTSPVSKAFAERLVDLDAIDSWIIMVLFCASHDFNQGLAYLDLSKSDSRWRFVTWDLDWSFQPWPPAYPNSTKDVWEATFIDYFMRPPWDLRHIAFRRLMEDDPQYRREFFGKLARAFNHVLTQDRLAHLIAKYRGIAEAFGGSKRELMHATLTRVQTFMRGRAKKVREALGRFYDVPPTHRCRVRISDGTRLIIDGKSYARTYAGEYFSGHSIRLEKPGEAGTWIVNGNPAGSRKTLEWSISEDTEITLRR